MIHLPGKNCLLSLLNDSLLRPPLPPWLPARAVSKHPSNEQDRTYIPEKIPNWAVLGLKLAQNKLNIIHSERDMMNCRAIWENKKTECNLFVLFCKYYLSHYLIPQTIQLHGDSNWNRVFLWNHRSGLNSQWAEKNKRIIKMYFYHFWHHYVLVTILSWRGHNLLATIKHLQQIYTPPSKCKFFCKCKKKFY